MHRIVTYTLSLSLALLLSLTIPLSGCMSLRHKVDPVSITLNVKLENVDTEEKPSTETATAASVTTQHPKYGRTSR